MLRHTYEPATTADVVMHWPDGARHPLSSGNFHIVVFAHPCCPCTRATLQKLDESLTRIPRATSVSVVFVTAGLNAVEALSSPSVAYARRLPGVDVRFDETGEEARRFRATTSGEVFAFDRQGRCLFHGGVTTGRGHLGDSAGQRELERLASGVARETCIAPVFGCALPAAGPGCIGQECTLIENN